MSLSNRPVVSLSNVRALDWEISSMPEATAQRSVHKWTRYGNAFERFM